MKMIPDWRNSWRWASMHAMTLALALQGAWLTVPDDLRQVMPAWGSYAVTIVLLLGGLIGRLVEQAPKPDATDTAGA